MWKGLASVICVVCLVLIIQLEFKVHRLEFQLADTEERLLIGLDKLLTGMESQVKINNLQNEFNKKLLNR